MAKVVLMRMRYVGTFLSGLRKERGMMYFVGLMDRGQDLLPVKERERYC